MFSVPSKPPQTVSGQNTSSTSLNISWNPVPVGFVHGILLGYRVMYKISSRKDNYFVNTTTLKQTIELEKLKKFTKYNIIVLAYTRIGNGQTSPVLTVSTDEDGV